MIHELNSWASNAKEAIPGHIMQKRHILLLRGTDSRQDHSGEYLGIEQAKSPTKPSLSVASVGSNEATSRHGFSSHPPKYGAMWLSRRYCWF